MQQQRLGRSTHVLHARAHAVCACLYVYARRTSLVVTKTAYYTLAPTHTKSNPGSGTPSREGIFLHHGVLISRSRSSGLGGRRDAQGSGVRRENAAFLGKGQLPKATARIEARRCLLRGACLAQTSICLECSTGTAQERLKRRLEQLWGNNDNHIDEFRLQACGLCRSFPIPRTAGHAQGELSTIT